MMNRVAAISLATALLLGTTTWGYFHLFRSVTSDTPNSGTLTYQYRWEKPHQLSADTNRDGQDDFFADYDGWADFTGAGNENWADRNFDGVLDMHIQYQGGDIKLARFDLDFDGSFEHEEEGEQVVVFLKTLAGSGS